MAEFNIRVSSIDRKGLMEVAEEIREFSELPCEILIGKSEIINEIGGIIQNIYNSREIYCDVGSIRGTPCNKLHGDKFPIDFAAVFGKDGYLIVKGKTVFGATDEIEGHSLALRIIANIKRNYT